MTLTFILLNCAFAEQNKNCFDCVFFSCIECSKILRRKIFILILNMFIGREISYFSWLTDVLFINHWISLIKGHYHSWKGEIGWLVWIETSHFTKNIYQKGLITQSFHQKMKNLRQDVDDLWRLSFTYLKSE